MELRRYSEAVRSVRTLEKALERSDYLATEPVSVSIDLEPIRAAFKSAQDSADVAVNRSALDAALVQPVHAALSGLDRRTAADIRFWHFLSIAVMPEIVWTRWLGYVPASPTGLITPALLSRFGGTPTLSGVSRNTFARLWWCGHTLAADTGDYTMARSVLQRQDLFQAIFERKFGLYRPAAVACIRQYEGSAEASWREGTKRLNHYLTTVNLESLTESDISALLRPGGTSST